VFDNNEVKVFEGTYQDFLDRVGWKSEGDVIPLSASQASAGTSAPSINKKNLRKLKAEIMTERTKIIGPLKSKVSGIEEDITRLEKQIDDDTAKLLEASVKGDGEQIKSLSRAIHEAKDKIDLLFKELAALTEELEIKTREFEERLSEFSEVTRARN
jgi:ATP-binding cassette subfamily F protein 3